MTTQQLRTTGTTRQKFMWQSSKNYVKLMEKAAVKEKQICIFRLILTHVQPLRGRHEQLGLQHVDTLKAQQRLADYLRRQARHMSLTFSLRYLPNIQHVSNPNTDGFQINSHNWKLFTTERATHATLDPRVPADQAIWCIAALGWVEWLYCCEIVKGWIGSRAIVEADSGRWELFAKGVDRGCDMVENNDIVLLQVHIGYEEFV